MPRNQQVRRNIMRWILGSAMLLVLGSQLALSQGQVTINWWDMPRGWAPPGDTENPNAWNYLMIERYEALNPDVNIEFTPIDWGEGPQKIRIGVIGGAAPDLTYLFPSLFGEVLSLDGLAPINAFLDDANREDFLPSAIDFISTPDGQMWGWPWWFGAEGEWVINLSVVEEAGAMDLVPEGPDYSWTEEEFLELAKACTFTRDNGEQVWGNAIATSTNSPVDIWPTWTYAWMFGATLYDPVEGVSNFASEGGTEALQFMYDLANTHRVIPSGAAGLTNEDIGELWTRKQVCIMTGLGVDRAEGIRRGLEAGSIEGPFETLAVLPPTRDGEELRVGGGVGVIGVFDNGDARRLEAAMEFAAWLTNEENLEILDYLTGVTPRSSTTARISAENPVTQWRLEHTLPYIYPYSRHPDDGEINRLWMQMLQAMFVGERTPEESAVWFETEVNRLLQAN